MFKKIKQHKWTKLYLDYQGKNINHPPLNNQLNDDISSADWALQIISNTAWDDAVKAGRRGLNCELTYANCKLSQSNLENFTTKLLKIAKQK